MKEHFNENLVMTEEEEHLFPQTNSFLDLQRTN